MLGKPYLYYKKKLYDLIFVNQVRQTLTFYVNIFWQSILQNINLLTI